MKSLRSRINRRTKQEQRLLADYALQEGGKACEARLKRKTENFLVFRLSLGEENGTPRLSRGQSELVHYAEAER